MDVANHPFIGYFPREQAAALSAAAEIHHFPADTVVFNETDASDSLILVLNGTLSVSKSTFQGRSHNLASVGPGQYCGEFGVYEASPNEDTIRWYRDVLEIFEKHGVSWANWNYKSDQFGFVGLDGGAIDLVKRALELD